MSGFTVIIQDAEHFERFEGVLSFVGEDASGSFGILAGHGRLMTLLDFGLARLRDADGTWRYLALPGGLLTFEEDTLVISTRRCLADTDYRQIGRMLEEKLRAEEEDLFAMRESLRRLEDQMLKSLWELERDR